MIKRFLNYVEIQTKIASTTPFGLGLLYAFYAYGIIDLRNTVLFFVSMLFFDMATTALNNYIGARKNENTLSFSNRISFLILLALLAAATITGITLAFYTGLVVLICGGICFVAGVFYTFGPAPIARLPLGEVFSGIFMGFFIPFLVIYINAPAQSLVYYTFLSGELQISLNLPGLFNVFLLTVPGIMCIANIMLANNICDLEKDKKVGRFTLPFYIGTKNALHLFALDYYIAFFAIIIIAAVHVLPVYILITLIPLLVVQKNINIFKKRHIKSETFHLSVQNLVLIMVPMIIVVAVAIFI